jgi:anti-sigma factor RsiW
MPCPHHETLIAYAAADLEPAERERVEAHLATGCAACERELETVAALRRIARSDALEDPPAGVLARAERVPEEARERGLGALAGRLAALVFDTLRDPLPLGARSSATHVRQMLYRAADYDIDVRVTPADGGRVRISGQVLPGPERSLDAAAGVEVALVGPELPVALVDTNELGEFDFGPQPEGDYTLSIEAPEERLVVDDLPARRT